MENQSPRSFYAYLTYLDDWMYNMANIGEDHSSSSKVPSAELPPDASDSDEKLSCTN